MPFRCSPQSHAEIILRGAKAAASIEAWLGAGARAPGGNLHTDIEILRGYPVLTARSATNSG